MVEKEALLDQGRSWVITWALVPAAMLLLLLSRAVWDVDIFWQLKLGELILQNGGPVPLEPFAASHLGEPLPAIAWAGQAVMAAVRLATGWTGLRIFDALCWLGGFWAAATAARRAGADHRALVVAMALALIAGLPVASIRPQSFAALCFGAALVLPGIAGRTWQRLAAAAILFVVWQNLHPSVAVAAVFFGARAAGEWAGLLWKKLPTAPLPIAPLEDTALAVIAALSMFATPDGPGLLATSAANAGVSRTMGVSEWLPLWAAINRQVAVPVMAVAIVAVWLIRRSRRADWREVLPALALFVLTALTYRFVLFWAIAMVPVVARAVPPVADGRAPRWLMPTALAGAALIGAVALPSRFAESMPLSQLAKLRASGIKGTVFSHFGWGGAVIDAGYPDWNVAFDGRYYRYSPDEWQLQADIAAGTKGISQLGTAAQPVALVLDPNWNAALIAQAGTMPSTPWRLFSKDDVAVIFVRRDQTGQPQRLPAAISNR